MNIDLSMVENIVKKVMEEALAEGGQKEETYSFGVFETMEEAIEAAHEAQACYMNNSIADREKFIAAIRNVILKQENLELLARMAAEETGMGNFEDKVIKNRLAASKTPGTEDLVSEAMSGDDGLTLVELSPYGVIGAITPTTNPTETVINNSIGMLAAGNSVVYGTHPRAKNVSVVVIQMINKALQEVGAPANLITTVAQPSVENTNILMNHPKVRMIVATGGPGIVTAAMTTGKKAIGAGAGNPPAVVDETADIEQAGRDIVLGASFDNNLPCTAEKEVIVVDQVADYLIFNMKKHGAYHIEDAAELKRLEAVLINEQGNPNKDYIGKSAEYILQAIGIKPAGKIKVITAETDKNHPFVQHELMMPVLGIVRAKDAKEAIDIAVEVEHGCRHTAIMHSKNIDNLTLMAKKIQTTIFVKNGPSYAGIGAGGEGYATFTIAGPTGEGLTSAKSFARRRRCVLIDGFHIR